jgi:hypothetical protein
MPWCSSDAKSRPPKAGISEVGVVEGRDEPIVIYCDAGRYLRVIRAMRAWSNGELNALVTL